MSTENGATKEAGKSLHGKVVQVAPPVADRVAALEAGQAEILSLLRGATGQKASTPSKPAKATTHAKSLATTITMPYHKASKRYWVYRAPDGSQPFGSLYFEPLEGQTNPPKSITITVS